MFESNGIKSPPWRVPSSVLETTPFIMTPAWRYLLISFKNDLKLYPFIIQISPHPLSINYASA